MTSMKAMLSLAVLGFAPLLSAEGQFATASAGMLVSKRVPDVIGELHAETPPVHATRGWITLSWTDESAKPTVITAVEHALVHVKDAGTGLGVGVLWLEPDNYTPYPIIVSSTVVPLPIPRTSFVAIASTQPFQKFDWSLALEVGVTLWFVR
jgi:hypothetical protein